MGRPSQDCFGSEEEVKPNKITHFEVEQTSFHDHSMLNGNRAQMGCQLAMTSGLPIFSQVDSETTDSSNP